MFTDTTVTLQQLRSNPKSGSANTHAVSVNVWTVRCLRSVSYRLLFLVSIELRTARTAPLSCGSNSVSTDVFSRTPRRSDPAACTIWTYDNLVYFILITDQDGLTHFNSFSWVSSSEGAYHPSSVQQYQVTTICPYTIFFSKSHF